LQDPGIQRDVDIVGCRLEVGGDGSFVSAEASVLNVEMASDVVDAGSYFSSVNPSPWAARDFKGAIPLDQPVEVLADARSDRAPYGDSRSTSSAAVELGSGDSRCPS